MKNIKRDPSTGTSVHPGFVVAVVVVLAGLTLGAYWWRFGYGRGWAAISTDTQEWGHLGDYLGGVLNPLVALAALGLLAWSVALQRKELAEIRETSSRQAEAAEQTAKLNALAIVVPWLEVREQEIQRSYESYMKGGADSGLIHVPEFQGGVHKFTRDMSALHEKRGNYMREAERILDAMARPTS